MSVNQYGFWGPPEGIDTQDYMLFIEGGDYVARPERLLGHTFTNPNIEQSDALTITRVKLSGGRVQTVVVTKRTPQERGRQYTVGFPSGALWTQAMQAAMRPGCRKTLYMKYLCPSDRKYNHADILPEATFDPLQPEGDLISVDDINPVAFTSIVRISEQFRIYELGWEIVYTDNTPNMEYGAVAFLTADCPGCADVPGLAFVAGGGDGTAAAEAIKTDDRFSTQAAMSTGAAIGQFVSAYYNDGSLIVEGTTDDFTPGTAATGSLHVSRDGGNTWSTISGITAPIYGIDRLGDTLFVVGGTGAGVPVLYKSEDGGKSWSAVSHTLISGTDAFLGIAVDQESGRGYIVGEGGTLLLLQTSGSAVTLTDLSGNLAGSPGALGAIAVLAKDFIAVGGAAGYYAESQDGGVSFTQYGVSGSTAIAKIAGDRWRTVVGAGTKLYERSVLTNYEFQEVTLENGVSNTGTIRDIKIRVGTADNFNMFVAVTSDAEVILGKPFLPNS